MSEGSRILYVVELIGCGDPRLAEYYDLMCRALRSILDAIGSKMGIRFEVRFRPIFGLAKGKRMVALAGLIGKRPHNLVRLYAPHSDCHFHGGIDELSRRQGLAYAHLIGDHNLPSACFFLHDGYFECSYLSSALTKLHPVRQAIDQLMEEAGNQRWHFNHTVMVDGVHFDRYFQGEGKGLVRHDAHTFSNQHLDTLQAVFRKFGGNGRRLLRFGEDLKRGHVETLSRQLSLGGLRFDRVEY